jgi:hypothetical protein
MRNTTRPLWLRLSIISLTFLIGADLSQGGEQAAHAGPAGAVVLIIRHAEKPESGSGLSVDGTKRANAYPGFFEHLKIDEKLAIPNELFATRDSENSERPRLTLEPLRAALHLPLNTEIKNKDFEVLADKLRGATYRGKTILICWHHGHIAGLLQALGATPSRLLPEGKWPENVYGWLIELRYDQEGRLKESAVINENLAPADAESPPPPAQ